MTDRMPTPVPPVLLLFDRNVLIRAAIADYLRDCGFTVRETGTVEEVNAVLGSEHHIDLAFLDIGDDSARGFTLAQMIRKARPHVKVMMASGVAGAAAGKPYDHSILERNIRRLLAS